MKITIAALLVTIAGILVDSAVLQLFWNWEIPTIFHLPALLYKQALALVMIVRSLRSASEMLRK